MKTINGENYTLIQGDCLDVMKGMEGGSVDLTVTSPPYDNLRDYGKGFDANAFDWHPIIKELYRVTAVGGVVVWVVADATINGSETGTSFRQALWAMECGFRLHDTMIYQQAGTGAKGSNLAYWQSFEYMFVFAKGKPKTVNRIADKKTTPKRNTGGSKYTNRAKGNGYNTGEYGIRSNIWRYQTGNNGDDQTSHLAPFPEALANDHIISWSNPGDLVFDPFLGSGTTGKMAIKNGRKFIGCDIEAEYVEIARQRIEDEVTAVRNRSGDFTTTAKEKANGQLALWDIV